MATTEQIQSLRDMTAETGASSTYTDEVLEEIIDASATLRLAAAEVWELKAAAVAALVNTSESGSSRSLGDLHKQYLQMMATYRSDPADAANGGRSATVRRIVRN